MRRARATAVGLFAVAVIVTGYMTMHSLGATGGARGEVLPTAKSASWHVPLASDHAKATSHAPPLGSAPTSGMLHVAGLCAALVFTIVSVRRRADRSGSLRRFDTVHPCPRPDWGHRPPASAPLVLGISRR